MRADKELQSTLGPTIAHYVAVKKALGRTFSTAHYHLTKLDEFLALRRADDLNAETFAEWCSGLEHLSPRGALLRMRIVYQFCLFRRRRDKSCFVPDPSQFPKSPPRFRPHIFTEREVGKLLEAACSLRVTALSPLRRHVARLAVVLLFTTGLRRGELTRLTLGDYDASERVLLVRTSKNFKSRLIPLSDDAAREVDTYLRFRCHPSLPAGANAALLVHKDRSTTGYTGAGLGRLVTGLFHQCGLHTASGKTPRVHDFRFSFAVHGLLRWYRAGIDVQSKLPALATYMGHVSITSTEYYLPFVGELAQAACEQFNRHCSRFLWPETV